MEHSLDCVDRWHLVVGEEDGVEQIDYSYYRCNEHYLAVGEEGVVQLDQWKPAMNAEAVAADSGMVQKVDVVVAALEAVPKAKGPFRADALETVLEVEVEVVAIATVGHPEMMTLNEALREEVASGEQGSPCYPQRWWVVDEVQVM